MKGYISRQFAKLDKGMGSRTADYICSIGWSVTGVSILVTDTKVTNGSIAAIVCFFMAQLIAGNRRRG